LSGGWVSSASFSRIRQYYFVDFRKNKLSRVLQFKNIKIFTENTQIFANMQENRVPDPHSCLRNWIQSLLMKKRTFLKIFTMTVYQNVSPIFLMDENTD